MKQHRAYSSLKWVANLGLWLALPWFVSGVSAQKAALAQGIVSTRLSTSTGGFTRHTMRVEWAPHRSFLVSKRVWDNGQVNYTMEYKGNFRQRFVLQADEDRWVYDRAALEIFAQSDAAHHEGRFVRNGKGGMVRLTQNQFNQIATANEFAFHATIYKDVPNTITTLTGDEWAKMRVWLQELENFKGR